MRIAIICFAQTIKYRDIFRIPDVIRIQFHRIQYFRLGVRIFYCRVRVSQTRLRARVRVFPESGFSSGSSPSPSPVRVSRMKSKLAVVCQSLFSGAYLRKGAVPSDMSVGTTIKQLSAKYDQAYTQQVIVEGLPFVKVSRPNVASVGT